MVNAWKPIIDSSVSFLLAVNNKVLKNTQNGGANMKKIAILTLNGQYNYGNRLQNYATQEVLKSLGFSVETIITDNKIVRAKKNFRYLSKKPIHYFISKIHDKLLRTIYKNRIKERTRVFRKFSSQYIAETSYSISIDKIPEDLSTQYDYFVTGSDQVWNPSNIYRAPIYFLTFTEKAKRIAYAPSFGVSKIPDEHKENYKKWISGINKLSVREDDGARIIKDLTGRDVPVLVDPTLLLTKEKWMTISKEASNKPKEKYLLTYFLGGVPEIYKRQIKKIAKENNLEIVKLGDITEKDTYITGPSEFIDYINSCSIFCTDSFHGVVFSILMEKPFIVYERMGTSSSMFSRIETLLNKFNLNSRKAENIRTDEEAFNIDYSHVPPLLEAERNKAINYLRDALNVRDGI